MSNSSIKLTDAPKGINLVIKRVEENQHHLAKFGFVAGQQVKIVSNSVAQPWRIYIRETYLAVDKMHMQGIYVENYQA